MIDRRNLGLLLFGHRLKLCALKFNLALKEFGLAAHGDVLARRHAERASKQACDTGEHNEAALPTGSDRSSDAHHQPGIRDKAVGDTEDDRAQRAVVTGAMPRLARLCLRQGGSVCAATLPCVEFAPDVGMLRLISGNIGDLLYVAMRAVDLLFVPLERLDHVAHRTGAKEAGKEGDLAHAPAWALGRRYLLAEAEELRLPDRGVSPLAGGDPLKGAAARRILLDLGEGVVQEDCVALERETGEACGAILDLLHWGSPLAQVLRVAPILALCAGLGLKNHPPLFVDAHHVNPKRNLGRWIERLPALKVESRKVQRAGHRGPIYGGR